jgi:hypothetical protein
MLDLLDRIIHPFLSDKIYRYIHKQFMKDLKTILETKTVWIIDKRGRLSFLILENNRNYYSILEDPDLGNFNKINMKKIKKIKK